MNLFTYEDDIHMILSSNIMNSLNIKPRICHVGMI